MVPFLYRAFQRYEGSNVATCKAALLRCTAAISAGCPSWRRTEVRWVLSRALQPLSHGRYASRQPKNCNKRASAPAERSNSRTEQLEDEFTLRITSQNNESIFRNGARLSSAQCYADCGSVKCVHSSLWAMRYCPLVKANATVPLAAATTCRAICRLLLPLRSTPTAAVFIHSTTHRIYHFIFAGCCWVHPRTVRSASATHNAPNHRLLYTIVNI